MKINIDVNSLEQFEFFLNTLFLGGVTALMNKKVHIDDIQHLMFSPQTVDFLKDSPVNPIYSDIALQLTEIEDISSLLPEKLDDYLKSLQNIILSNYKSLYMLKHEAVYIDLLFEEAKYPIK